MAQLLCSPGIYLRERRNLHPHRSAHLNVHGFICGVSKLEATPPPSAGAWPDKLSQTHITENALLRKRTKLGRVMCVGKALLRRLPTVGCRFSTILKGQSNEIAGDKG